MFVLNGNGLELVNTAYVERFCIVLKADAALIVASYSKDRAVTLGRYADEDAARDALTRLHLALSDNAPFALDTNSTECADNRPRHGYHGAHAQGHGGS